MQGAAVLRLQEAIVSRNAASSGAAGALAGAGVVQACNAAIVDNTAALFGGAVYAQVRCVWCVG